MQPRHSNPYEHVSDTPTSVRAEVQRGNYCTFLHIWMMLRSIELFPQERVFRRLVALPSSSYRCGAHHPPLEPPSWRVSPSLLAASSSKYFHDKSRYTRVFMPRWRRPRRRWGFPAIVSFPPPLPLLYLHVEWNWFKRAPFFSPPLLYAGPLARWGVCVCPGIMRLLARVLWRGRGALISSKRRKDYLTGFFGGEFWTWELVEYWLKDWNLFDDVQF